MYFFFPFSLFVSVYVYASVCDFVCIVLLLPFVRRSDWLRGKTVIDVGINNLGFCVVFLILFCLFCCLAKMKVQILSGLFHN